MGVMSPEKGLKLLTRLKFLKGKRSKKTLGDDWVQITICPVAYRIPLKVY